MSTAASVAVAAKTSLLVGLLFHGATPLEPTVDPAYKAAWRPEPAIVTQAAEASDLIWRQESPNGFYFLVSAWSQPKPTAADPAPAHRSVVAIWPKGHRLVPASIVATQALVVLDGMELEQALWTENSRYVAFTAKHADGQDSWNHAAFVLDVATRQLYPVQPVSGPVVGAELAWADNGDLRVWAALMDAHGGLDVGKRVQADIPLGKVMEQAPVGTAATWVSAYPADLDEAK
jgi:hypothetical protein